MSNLFNKVSIRKPKKNNFDLSHERKLSCQFGDLIPINCMEVMPGDKFRVSTELMARLAPLIAPIMAHCNIFVHHWYVPMRLVFDDWQKFITGGKDGLANIVMPKLTINQASVEQFRKGKLPDYFGIPPVPSSVSVPADEIWISALPFRAYQLIYNEFYRDQTLDDDLFDIAGGGTIGKGQTLLATEQAALVTMRKRCWEKDYFTSALPWAQRGGEVELPIDASMTFTPEYAPVTKAFRADSGLPSGVDGTITQQGSAQGNVFVDAGMSMPGRIENLAGSTEYDVEGTNVTINDLRRSIRLQEWLEKNARAGSRYIEQILSHFGVISSDARLQRPEFLGGGKSPMVISEVLSTVTSESAPQGNMAGHGISVGASAGFKKFFEEHGYVISILSIMPRSSYGQGIEKMWRKFDKLDFAWPEFASLGEQVVNNSELYMDYQHNSPDGTPFGYQSRYAEYKYKLGSIHGDFRDTLKHWHMCRLFDDQPGLNSQFVHMDDAEIARVFNVIDQDVDHVYISLFNRVNAIRPLPYFGTPML